MKGGVYRMLTLDNVLDHHLEVYEKELDEMVRLSTQNSH